jgi:two-component system nitrate/nitrite response regulator NarL
MVTAIVKAMAGESIVSPEMTGKLVTAFQSLQTSREDKATSTDEPSSSLSSREEEILGQIAQGLTNKEIARAMNIAEATVKIHVQHILRKLTLSSRVQAATYAVARAI